MAKKAPKRKRLVRGRDFHYWAYQYPDGTYDTDLHRTKLYGGSGYGEWVRIKLVKVT